MHINWTAANEDATMLEMWTDSYHANMLNTLRTWDPR